MNSPDLNRPRGHTARPVELGCSPGRPRVRLAPAWLAAVALSWHCGMGLAAGTADMADTAGKVDKAAAAPGQGATGPREGEVLLPPWRATALWQDSRWRTFEAVVLAAFEGCCERPPVEETWVKVTPPAPVSPAAAPHSADFASDHAELRLSCRGRDGLVAVQVRAEFVRMSDKPLDLSLTLVFKQ